MVSRGEMYCYRYAPILPGEYRIYERRGKTVCKEYGFAAVCGDRHGFVKVSEKDRRYFAYTDSNPFMPIGINMAFPQSFAVSDGSEFGQSDNIAYIGWLRTSDAVEERGGAKVTAFHMDDFRKCDKKITAKELWDNYVFRLFLRLLMIFFTLSNNSLLIIPS